MNKNLPLLFLATTLWICCYTNVSAQNLVENPSFEQFSSCPQGISEFYLCTDWYTATTVASDSCSTPDLYATCAGSLGGVNVPNALLGYHLAYTGTGFAGQILGDGVPGCLQTGDNYREYLEGTLSTPLVAGHNYQVVIYMSLADASMWGSNSYGVYFTNSLYTYDACPNSLINVTPQLEMCGPAIMDTVNWVPVEWIYTATGGEKYFTLGNFKDDANTNHVTHNCGSFNPYIYYYIGLVSISPVGANDCGVSLVTDSVNATCGATNGSVAVTAAGCTSPFTYSWTNNATTAVVQNVGPGTYTVTVTDASNCHETASVSVNSKAMKVTATGVNPSCGTHTGSASVTITLGTGPYTYSWSNGGTTDSITSLGTGSYYVTVNGNTGCTAQDSISLLSSSALTLAPSVVSGAGCGSSTGSATVTVSGESGPFTFSWSNGQTTQTATNLAAGTYTVTVNGDTSSSGNTPFWSENFNGADTALWTLNTAGTTGPNGNSANRWIINNDATCNCTTGNYLHITNNISNTSCLACLEQIPQGSCTYLEFPSLFSEGDFATDVLAISPVISTLGRSNMVLNFTWECLGTPGSDYGLVDLSNDGGSTWTALPFNYDNESTCTQASINIPINYQNIATFRIAFEWINGAGSLSNAGGNPPGFAIDSITLTATASNCPAIASVTVPASGGLDVSAGSSAPPCGSKNGIAWAVVSGGTTPYTYAWNAGGPTDTITHLDPGVYVVTVTSAGGCSATASTTLFIGSGNITAAAVPTGTTCGLNNGTITVSATGASNYVYSWSNGASTASINNLNPDTYTVTVTVAGANCTAIASGTIDTSSALTISTFGGRAGCTSSGTAVVDINSGTGPYTYSWNNGATSSSINSLSAGNYSVTVNGAGGCSASATVTVISTGTGVTLTSSATPTGCSSSTGSISVDATTGDSPFTYSWSNGGTAATVSNVGAGTYTVTVTASGGCSATASDTVTASGTLSLTASAVGTTCGNSNGSASVNAGTGTFTYSWSNQATTSTISNVAAGTYTVTVQESGGCSGTASAVVNPSGGAISIEAQPAAVCEGDTSQVCAPSGYQSYHWNLGQTSACISVTQAGSYYVTVTDNSNCTDTSNHVAVTVNAVDTIHVTLSIGVHGDTLRAGAASSYQWYFNGQAINGATSSSYIAMQDGNYYVKTTDANSCTAPSNTVVVSNILGIDELSAGSNIKVYPNPLANGNWHLDVSSDWVGSYCEVYDAAGRLVFKSEIKSTQNEFELNVAQGVYILRVNSEQKNYAVKLIKL